MPPTELPTIPEVKYDWIVMTPEVIQVSGLAYPGPDMRLAVRISAAASTGITQGAGLPVLLDAGSIPERRIADVTGAYRVRTGMVATPGKKYFIETAWMHVFTGLSGPVRMDSKICRARL